MRDLLIACRLQPAPSGRLPPWGGLLDTAEEHGLWNYILRPGLHRLPEGLLWGRFEDEASGLAALDSALAAASDLLGYPVSARGRLALPTDNLVEAEIPFAQAQALLYLSHR